jgi:hypothetical protein
LPFKLPAFAVVVLGVKLLAKLVIAVDFHLVPNSLMAVKFRWMSEVALLNGEPELLGV